MNLVDQYSLIRPTVFFCTAVKCIERIFLERTEKAVCVLVRYKQLFIDLALLNQKKVDIGCFKRNLFTLSATKSCHDS